MNLVAPGQTVLVLVGTILVVVVGIPTLVLVVVGVDAVPGRHCE